MAVFMITWDLNKEKPNYAQARAKFIAQLDGFTESRTDSGLDSVRFVSTNWDAQQISDYLRKAQDTNDTLLVIRIVTGTANRAGWLNKETWDWIEAREQKS